MKANTGKTIGWAVKEATTMKQAKERALERGLTEKASRLEYVESRWWKVVEALRLLEKQEGKGG